MGEERGFHAQYSSCWRAITTNEYMMVDAAIVRRPIELDRHCEERSDEATQGPRQTALC
jgi:hypothetical protein